MRRLLLLTLLASTAACGSHDVPDHDVSITVECEGSTIEAEFHFDAHDFEPLNAEECTAPGLDCGRTIDEGEQLSGDELVVRVFIDGADPGTAAYNVVLDESLGGTPGKQPLCIVNRGGDTDVPVPCSSSACSVTVHEL